MVHGSVNGGYFDHPGSIILGNASRLRILRHYFVNLGLKLLLALSLRIQDLHEVHLVKAELTGTAVYSIACQ